MLYISGNTISTEWSSECLPLFSLNGPEVVLDEIRWFRARTLKGPLLTHQFSSGADQNTQTLSIHL